MTEIPAKLTGLSQAKCELCGRVFSRVSGFDAHLIRQKDRGRATLKITCQNPSKVGMAQNDRGIWRKPSSDYTHSYPHAKATRPQNGK